MRPMGLLLLFISAFFLGRFTAGGGSSGVVDGLSQAAPYLKQVHPAFGRLEGMSADLKVVSKNLQDAAASTREVFVARESEKK